MALMENVGTSLVQRKVYMLSDNESRGVVLLVWDFWERCRRDRRDKLGNGPRLLVEEQIHGELVLWR